MTKEAHIKRHKALHKALDELVADWIACSAPVEGMQRLPSKRSVLSLMEWSHRQTIMPEDPATAAQIEELKKKPKRKTFQI